MTTDLCTQGRGDEALVSAGSSDLNPRCSRDWSARRLPLFPEVLNLKFECRSNMRVKCPSVVDGLVEDVAANFEGSVCASIFFPPRG